MIPVPASSGLSVVSVAEPPTATTCPARSGLLYGNSGRKTGRLGTVSNPVVSSVVSRGYSSGDIFTTAATPVSVTRGRAT